MKTKTLSFIFLTILTVSIKAQKISEWRPENRDVLFALDMSGKILWKNVIGHAWDQLYPDSRATPTVEGNRIYTCRFWAHPVIHNGVLYIRHSNALMAYNIKTK